MRGKLVALFVVAAAFAPGSPAVATTHQVDATVLYPTVVTGTAGNCLPSTEGCEKLPISRHHRCTYLLAPEQAQSAGSGRFGYTIAVPAGYRTFTLESTPPGAADLDVAFYLGLGTCESNPPAFPSGVKSSFARFGPDAGPIPAESAFAIVTLFGSNNAAFRFTATR